MTQSDLSGTLVQGLYVRPRKLVVTGTIAGSPQRFSDSVIHFRHAIIQGRSEDGTANVSTVRFGITGGDGEDTFPVASDAAIKLSADDDTKYSFRDFWLTVAADGDSLVIWYN